MPEGGPQEGVSGEMGAKPGSLPEGGPQEGVSGEMGAKPGSLPTGGPQEGVSGETGAKPGSLLPELSEASGSWAMVTLSEAERSGFSPFLSIYIEGPFYLIANANGMLYHMPGGKGCAGGRKDFGIFFRRGEYILRWLYSRSYFSAGLVLCIMEERESKKICRERNEEVWRQK